MTNRIATALAFDQAALGLRYERQKVLSNNIANADTPNFKARDFHFAEALDKATRTAGTSDAGNDLEGQLAMATSSTRDLPAQNPAGSPALLYRVPFEPSLDGNTVDMNAERAVFTDNALHYQAAVTLINNKIQNLKTAMQPVSGS